MYHFGTINQLKNLPESKGIYFVIKNGHIEYIGISKTNLKQRWLHHHRKDLLNGDWAIFYMATDMHNHQLRQLERYLQKVYLTDNFPYQ